MKPIIIAGLGRCGTTLIRNTFETSGYVRPEGFLKIIRPDNYENGVIYKTHAFPTKTLQSDVKLIFLYDNPYDIIYSTYKKMNWWGKAHHLHFESNNYEENKSILRNDTLGLNKMFKSWMTKKSYEFLTVPYASLGDIKCQKIISCFSEHEFEIKTFKKRKPLDDQSEEYKMMKNVYSEAYEIFNKYPDIKWWR